MKGEKRIRDKLFCPDRADFILLIINNYFDLSVTRGKGRYDPIDE